MGFLGIIPGWIAWDASRFALAATALVTIMAALEFICRFEIHNALIRKRARWMRRFSQLFKYFWLIFESSMAGIAAIAAWSVVRAYGIHFSAHDSDTIGMFVAVLLFTIYGVGAGLVLVTEWGAREAIENAAFAEDYENLERLVNHRIPGFVHLLLGMVCFYGIGTLMLIRWDEIWAGGTAIFIVASIVTLYWQIVMEFTMVEGAWGIPGISGHLPGVK